MKARRRSQLRSSSGRRVAPRSASKGGIGRMTGAFRSPRNRLRWTGPFDRITSGRYSLPGVEDLSLSELGILLAAAICTALGFADQSRAPLFAGRLVAIVTLPTVIAVRSYFRPSIAERRGQRSPLWIATLSHL